VRRLRVYQLDILADGGLTEWFCGVSTPAQHRFYRARVTKVVVLSQAFVALQCGNQLDLRITRKYWLVGEL
jgi:hypothetical protein